jgi:hypothetical protein
MLSAGSTSSKFTSLVLLLVEKTGWIQLQKKRAKRTEPFANALLNVGHDIF